MANEKDEVSPQPTIRLRSGARTGKVKAEVVASELFKIHAAGQLTPAAVVESAAPIDSPLHAAFEWDDSVAANEHRLAQARQLIRAVCVRDPNTNISQSVFVHVVEEKQGRYEPLSVVVQSQTLFDSALGKLMGQLEGVRKGVNELRVAAGVSPLRLEPIRRIADAVDRAHEAAKVIE